MAYLPLNHLTLHPLIVPMARSFGIAGGSQEVARNLLVRLTLGDGTDGTVGLGEAAPFPAASGETFESTLTALKEAEDVLRTAGDLNDYRAVCAALCEAFSSAPAALCGLEIALFDALTRHRRQDLRSFFGGAETLLTTDITIVTGTTEEARIDAERAVNSGFRILKIKIGGADLDEDVRRLRAILGVSPQVTLILDANAAYTSSEALSLLTNLGEVRQRIALFEQPVAPGDLEGLRRVEQEGGVRVAADESLRSREDLAQILKVGGISGINIKTAKLGVLAAWDLLREAKSRGLLIMVGGMVETELSMSTSACLAAGVGGVHFIDLDTPLFMGPRRLQGGYAQSGATLDLTPIAEGHGVTWLDEPSSLPSL